MLKQYAHEVCGDRLLMVLEGGYNPVSLEASVLTTVDSLLTSRQDKIGVFFSERAHQLIKNHPLRNYWTLQ
jgi:acetoin utilization deacetylase AcuC-like enzyme